MSDRDRARELSERLDQVLELDTTARAAWLADFERTEPAVAAELRELLLPFVLLSRPFQLRDDEIGKFKALAVGAPERLAVLPDVPTLAELGLPAANLTSHFGVFAPGRTPESVIARINEEIGAVLRSAGFREQIIASGNLPGGGAAGDFARQIAIDSARNLAIVKVAGIKLD